MPDTVRQAVRLRPTVAAQVIGTTDDSAAVFALVGIAVEETAVGPARTGVFLTADGDVQFAGTGQSVGAGRFRVSEISTHAVVLICSTTGVSRRLVLQ